jgi:hypothetical protein
MFERKTSAFAKIFFNAASCTGSLRFNTTLFLPRLMA